MSTKLEQAISVVKAGDKATGQQLLTELLKADPRNEQAWLWMTQVTDTIDDRLKCLQNVLKINPNNEIAKRGLAALQQEQVGQPQPAATPHEAPALSGEAALQQITAARARGLTPDLSEANLAQANLSGADLSEVNLRGANLSQANLSQANLRYANLIGANLSGTDLSSADLNGAYLSEIKHNYQTIWPAGFTIPDTQQSPVSPQVEIQPEVTALSEGRKVMSEQKVASVGWGFWFQWVLTSTVGFGITGFGSLYLIGPLVGPILQWLILRTRILQATAWVWVSILGWAIGFVFFLLVLLVESLERPPSISPSLIRVLFVRHAAEMTVTGAVVGAVVGLMQWTAVLRRQVSQALWSQVLWWVLSSTVGWAIVGWAITLHTYYYPLSVRGMLPGVIAWASYYLPVGDLLPGMTGAVYGAITGFALVWLLRQPHPEAQRVATDSHQSASGD